MENILKNINKQEIGKLQAAREILAGNIRRKSHTLASARRKRPGGRLAAGDQYSGMDRSGPCLKTLKQAKRILNTRQQKGRFSVSF